MLQCFRPCRNVCAETLSRRAQTIPAVRALLSTSWDPEIRLAEERARAAAAAGQNRNVDHGTTLLGTMLGEGEDKVEGTAGAEDGGVSGDAGGGGGGDGGGGDAASG